MTDRATHRETTRWFIYSQIFFAIGIVALCLVVLDELRHRRRRRRGLVGAGSLSPSLPRALLPAPPMGLMTSDERVGGERGRLPGNGYPFTEKSAECCS